MLHLFILNLIVAYFILSIKTISLQLSTPICFVYLFIVMFLCIFFKHCLSNC